MKYIFIMQGVFELPDDFEAGVSGNQLDEMCKAIEHMPYVISGVSGVTLDVDFGVTGTVTIDHKVPKV